MGEVKERSKHIGHWRAFITKRKRNGKLLSGNETQFYCDIEEVVIHYKHVYFNAIDTIVACIQDWQAFEHVRTLSNFFYEEQRLTSYIDDWKKT